MKNGSKIIFFVLLALAVLLAALLFLQPLLERSPSSPETDSTLPAPTQTELTIPTSEETAPPTEAPTEPDDPNLARARELLSGMSLYEKLCQLMILSPDTITGVSPTQVAGDVSRAALEKYPVGGFSFSQENISNREQTINMLAGFQGMSKIPMFFCLDEEGGTVWRVMGNSRMGTTRIGRMYDYRDEGGQTAYRNAEIIATDIAALGFNVDFAPVADVWSNPDNEVIGSRAYSDDFTQAAELVPHAVRGFHAGGVACTLKHFPGHGCTVEDSHKGLAVVKASEQELREGELLPFIAGINAGADMVMIGHLQVDALDPDNPATFSYKIVTELLREELGFQGVVITDSLGMGAISQYSEAERCEKALLAGCDILLGVREPEQTLHALMQAVEQGEITQERIDESVLRVLYLKFSMGLIE